jgi:hypothetical protein
MRTTMNTRDRRGRLLVLLLVSVLGATTAAWAFWSQPGKGSASGHVGSLSAPAISSAAPGGGTVALTWSAVTAPGGGAVSYYVSRDGGAASSACPSVAAPATQTSCTDTGVSAATHSYVVTAVWRSWTAKSSPASAQVTSGAATHLVLTPATTSPSAGAADNLTVTAKDAANLTVTSYAGTKSLTFSGASTIGPLHPSVSDSSGAASEFGTATAISFTAGVASVSSSNNGVMKLYKAETASVKVSDGSINNGSGVSVTVTAGTASGFALSTATRTAGTAFTEEIVARDSSGNTATSYTGERTIAFSGPGTSPNGKTPVYSSGAINFVGGVATSRSITLFDADEAATLTATQGALSGTSASFAVSAAGISSFALGAAPQTAGVHFFEPITAQDAYGNTATSYTGTRTIGFTGPGTSPEGDSPKYTTSVLFTAGAGTSDITLDRAETPTLKATASVGSYTGSVSFVVSAANATKLSFSTISTQTAGSAFEATITAKDSFGNTVTSYAGTKAITFGGAGVSPLNNTPKYPATVTFSGGSGKAASITLYNASATTLTAGDGTISGTSASFNVNAQSTSRFAVSTPSPAAGTSFNDTVTAQDAYGNTTTAYTGKQTLTFSGPSKSPDNTSPQYPTSVTFTSGVGTAAITLYDVQTTTLTVTQSPVTGASASFTVAPGASGNFGLATPASQTAGVAFELKLKAQDTYGNPLTSYEGSKTVSFKGPGTSPNGKTPAFPATVNFSGGVGSASVTLYDADSSASIEASQGSLNDETANFTVNAASASNLSFGAESLSPTAGESDELIITALDAFGNTATSYTGTRNLIFSGAATIGSNHPSVTNSSGSAIAFGSTTAVSFSGGIARETFFGRNGVMRLYAAETAQISATDSASGGPTTAVALAVTVGAGSLSTFSVATPSAQTAGTAFNLTIAGKDSYGNGLSGPQMITFSGVSSSPGGTPPSYPSSVTFAAGVGTASVTLFTADPTTMVTATRGSANASTSNFTVNPATAAKLAWSGASSASGSLEGLCLFTCTWNAFGRSHIWTAKVSVTDANGNVVSNIGSGHTVTWAPAPTSGSVSPTAGLPLPSSGAATTSSSVTYTSSGSNSWTSDTLTAHSTGYGDATVNFKK